MAIIDPCKSREPRVIDNLLIKKCIDYQFPKGEIGRLMREDGIPIEEIKEIRFEFMNILKIDHLWVLKSLTKLQLNNNYIEKIENIDTLIHLKELDLSFNKISKIENLDALVNLEKLNFYENFLEVLENMDDLKKLTIFSVGKNNISDRANVTYLRRFPNLVSLNMALNPCTEGDNFRIYIAAFLPHLVYYEYRKIEEDERKQGLTLYERSLRDLRQIEEEETLRRSEIEKEKADAELHAVSFVEYLNSRHLFDSMFEGDTEGKALLDMGEDVEEFYVEFETQFVDLCKQAFEVGQKHYKLRTDEIDQFSKTVEDAKTEDQSKSVAFMEAFLEQKASVFAAIRTVQEQLDDEVIDEHIYNVKLGAYSKVFDKQIHDTWKKLMKLEVQISEQLEDVNQNLERALAEMINAFIEEAQAIFTLIRGLESAYTDNLSDVASRYLTNANLSDNKDVPDSLRGIMGDKEALNSAIATTHDLHLQIIDNREDVLVSRARKWLETFVQQLNKDEINRNRYKLLEINHFLDIQREEFHELKTDNMIPVKPEDLEDFFIGIVLEVLVYACI